MRGASASLLKAYQDALTTAPLATKLVTSFCIFGIGEVNAQLLTSPTAKIKRDNATLTDRASDIHWNQVFGFACLAFYNAPAMHTFFSLTAELRLGTRVVINLLLIDPMNFSAAILLKSIVQGQSFSEALATLQGRFWTTFRTVLCTWPFVHLVNNALVPLELRVLGFNCAALVWNTYLCWTMQGRQEKR